MANDRIERWGFVGVIAFCCASWYWDWASFTPRWVWAFVGVGFGLLHLAKSVDQLQKEVATLQERLWRLESKVINHDGD
ncbi:hypothetical protein [Duganella sp. HH105]|uniref:hypothetical protein n=1 Tax=Duganella sp. HH105 TaxID=1781067 RepID=UPI0008933956|nr:hypothetical protein [Duganella sp. HH105]OEZ54228.1 hypothetical protein DUGA6_58630 [Duganella sp. HH105]